MRKIKVRFGIGYGTHTDFLEFEDDATDDEIGAEVMEFVNERVDWGWEEVDG